MNQQYSGDRDLQLNQLLDRYREACGAPEAGANFMPGLWRRIDAKQSKRMTFERMAKSLAAAAAGISLALGVILAMSVPQPTVFSSSSYVEAIATDTSNEFGTFAAPPRLELTSLELRGR